MRLYLTNRYRLAKTLASTIGIRTKYSSYWELMNGDVVLWFFGKLLDWADPRPLPGTSLVAPLAWGKKPAHRLAQDILHTIESLMHRSSSLVHFGEANASGQLLIDEIIAYFSYNKPIYRLWINNLNQNIEDMLINLSSNLNYRSLFSIAYNRSRMDALFALNVAPLWHHALDRTSVVVLNMIAERNREIHDVERKPSFEVKLYIGGIPAKCTINHVGSKSFVLKLVADWIRFPAIVKHIHKVEKSVPPPMPLNLSDIQKIAATQLNYSSQKTLRILESLYENHHLITYPKSSSRYLNDSFYQTARHTLHTLTQLPDFSTYVQGTSFGVRHSCFNPPNHLDSFAVVPTGNDVPIEKLSGEEISIFEIIAKSYIALFYPSYTYSSIEIHYQIDQYVFKAHIYDTINMGWKLLLGKVKRKSYPIPKVGTRLPISNFSITQHSHQSILPYTESSVLLAINSLIHQADNQDASAVISSIEQLRQHNLIRNSGKSLIVTPEGLQLLSSLPLILYDKQQYIYWENSLQNDSYQTVDDYIVFLSDILSSYQEVLPACPKCGLRTLQSKSKVYQCTNCDWIMQNSIANYQVTIDDLNCLVLRGYTDKINLFMTRDGKPFAGYLSLTEPDYRLKILYSLPPVPLNCPCPSCQHPTLSLSDKAVSCSNCGYSLWRTICHYTLTQDEVLHLLSHKYLVCTKLQSKQNKTFTAIVLLQPDGQTKLSFEFSKYMDHQ
jgi:DNA topoisomerase-3